VAAGLVVSYHAGTSGSATMAVLPVALFFVVLTARTLANGHRERATARH